MNAEFAGNSLLRMVIIDIESNTSLGGLTLDPAGMHCPWWDDAFVSSFSFLSESFRFGFVAEERSRRTDRRTINAVSVKLVRRRWWLAGLGGLTKTTRRFRGDRIFDDVRQITRTSATVYKMRYTTQLVADAPAGTVEYEETLWAMFSRFQAGNEKRHHCLYMVPLMMSTFRENCSI